jgi:phosphoribosylformylglycinamidine synthase
MAQLDLGIGSIGGKDSMSGSFEDLDVPPTLVSFATAVGSLDRVTSPEFKHAGSKVVLVQPRYGEDGITPDPASLLSALSFVEKLIGDGDALAVSTVGYGCLAEALFKMCVGNQLGAKLWGLDASELFVPAYGSFVVEVSDCTYVPRSANGFTVRHVGDTAAAFELVIGDETVELAPEQEAWEARLEPVFPYRAAGEAVEQISWHATKYDAPRRKPSVKLAKPRVIIPVFPGNNCEYDSARAFRRAGAEVTTFVINNLTPAAVVESTNKLVEEIDRAQIVMIPGGFSGGDEPDGSAKFITAFFRAPQVTEAVRRLLNERDGLMLGICNGFQALVKLGLVPYGDIVPMTDACPTLTFNTIGRHQSRLVRTRVASDLSPWLSKCSVGDVHNIAISHGEGRFVASDELLAQLVAGGQIATQYVDEAGMPSMDLSVNPNGSALAIEGITSPDGRVLGKMGHTERSANGLYQNVPGNAFQPLIEGGVAYFTE